MKTGIRPSDVGAKIDPDDPTKWVEQLPRLAVLSLDEMLDRYLMVDGNGVMLNQSTISGAGLGVFIMDDVPKGTVLTKYEGALVARNTLDEIHFDITRSKFGNKEELLGRLHSHTILLNLNWVVMANFYVDAPLSRESGGDAFTSRGLYHVNNPLSIMRGKGLGGYINTLFSPLSAATRPSDLSNDFNVRFETIMDGSPLPKDVLARWRAIWTDQPRNFIKAAVAVRDLRKGEELFADYNRGGGSSSHDTIKSTAYIPEAHQHISWVLMTDD
jgi:hypothetical protein